jgi:hypothetical protein
MKTLQEIGLKHGTDKATLHKFLDFYESHLKALRDKPLNILEIGIWNGESLKTWSEYFPKSTVYAIDIEDKKQYNSNRIKTDICDQTDVVSLMYMFRNINFDLIIDDGGHKMNQQQLSLILTKRLTEKGIYIIEDLHTSNMAGYRDNKPFETSTLHVLNEWFNTNRFDFPYLNKELNDYLTDNIESVDLFFNNSGQSITSLLKKR